MTDPYQDMLRDIVRSQDLIPGRPQRLELTDQQLGVALREDSDVLTETAAEMIKEVIAVLSGNLPIAPPFATKPEFIGYILVAAMKSRARRIVHRDALLKAADMEQDDAEDDAYTHRGELA